MNLQNYFIPALKLCQTRARKLTIIVLIIMSMANKIDSYFLFIAYFYLNDWPCIARLNYSWLDTVLFFFPVITIQLYSPRRQTTIRLSMGILPG